MARSPCKIHAYAKKHPPWKIVAADLIGVEGNLCGSGRYRARVETVKGRQRMARRSSLSFFSRFRGQLTYTRRRRFRVDLFLPSLVFRTVAHSYVFTRALFVRTYIVFLTISALCFNSSIGMFTEADMSISVIQYYLSIVLMCTF